VTRVVIVDSDEIIRRGLTQLLSEQVGIEPVGQADSYAGAASLLGRLRPDVVIVEAALSDGSGISLCRAVRAELQVPAAFLMFSGDRSDETVAMAFEAGASGYLLKQASATDIVDAVRRVADGEHLLDSRLVASVIKLLRTGPQPAHGELELLSSQERRILELIAKGLTNRQIGLQLFVTEKTIKNYVSTILRKLGLESRTQAAVFALQHARAYVDQPAIAV
jgi:two-component system response regulator DevR